MTAWWRLCIGGFAATMLVACQTDKAPEQTTADSTTMAASTAVTTADTNLAPVETASVSTEDTGTSVTTTVVTQETNAPAATKTTTTTSTTSAAPASGKTTVQPVEQQPARTEPMSQPAPGTKPVEAAPARETETAKPTPPATKPVETAGDPKAIFLQEKCTSCHSITSAGIADKVQRDLSGIGAKRSESWITQFLQHQVDLDGKKHKKTFKGTEEELRMVARWLAAMK